jgi:hypothetical protein
MLFVIAVEELLLAASHFLEEFVDNQGDHSSKNPHGEQGEHHDGLPLLVDTIKL